MEVNRADFAKMAGVTRQSVGEKIKRKKLILNSAGMLDTENPINALYIENHRKKNNPIVLNFAQQVARQKELVQCLDSDDAVANKAGVAKTMLGLTLRELIRQHGGLVGLERHAKILRDLTIIDERNLKMDERRIELVSKNFVTSRLFQFLNELTTKLLEMPDSIADQIIASVLSGGTGVREKIVNEIRLPMSVLIKDAKQNIIFELESMKKGVEKDPSGQKE